GEIRLLHQLQNFEVVALDDQVLACIEIKAFIAARKERTEAWTLDGFNAVRLTGPVHSVAFFARIGSLAQHKFQAVEVDLPALSAHLWEKADNFRLLVANDLMRQQIQTFGLLGRRGLADSALSVRTGHRYSPSSIASE